MTVKYPSLDIHKIYILLIKMSNIILVLPYSNYIITCFVTYFSIEKFSSCIKQRLNPFVLTIFVRQRRDSGRDKNVLHVICALEGKHIPVIYQRQGRNKYFNHKEFYSLVLIALVDTDYKFIWCDITATGFSCDRQIYR